MCTACCRYYSRYWHNVCYQSRFPFQCWYLNFDEDDTFEPGVFESLGMIKEPELNTRDRHLRLKYKYLERALPEILSIYVSFTVEDIKTYTWAGRPFTSFTLAIYIVTYLPQY